MYPFYYISFIMWFWNLLWWVLWLAILIPLWLYILFRVCDWIVSFIKFLFSPIREYLEKKEEEKRSKLEEEKEKEYQKALARWNKNAKISKDYYFMMKTVKARENEEKKRQEKINKYGANISDEEVERIERIRRQKAEYEALPQEEKDKIKKKHKRDWIIIIVAFLSPYILFWLLLLIAKIIW